jgi:hypothetical protein
MANGGQACRAGHGTYCTSGQCDSGQLSLSWFLSLDDWAGLPGAAPGKSRAPSPARLFFAAYIAELPKAEHDVAEPVQNLLSGEGSGPGPLPSTGGRAYICVRRRAVRKCGRCYRLASVQNDRSRDGR